MIRNGVIIQKEKQPHLVFQCNIDYIINNTYLVEYVGNEDSYSTIYVDENKTWYILNSHLKRVYSYIKLNYLGCLIIEKDE